MIVRSSSVSTVKAITQIKDSAAAGKLVAVIGTGVSLALTDKKNHALSWKGLIENGFEYGATKGKITSAQKVSWQAQLDSADIDDVLGAAEFMGRKLDAPDGDLYGRWLENVFKEVTPEKNEMSKAIRAMQTAGVPISTLNYDSLLERVTGLPGIALGETTKVASWMRRESRSILHLHGSWHEPATCILGIRDYETTLSDEVRDLIQRNLGSFSRLLFIGCGDTFVDPNFSALIKWLRERMKTAAPQHYALVSAAEEARRNADPSWHGFVDPVSYGPAHDDLPAFLLKHFPAAALTVKTKKAAPTKSSTTDKFAKALEEYRSFLLKDCGQMTIEGVRADMDTAQRRFELEKLFVPLRVLATPPEFPASDPEREQKLRKWYENNLDAVSFGRVFTEHKHLALLALPGGGKSLLLKRLVVAYADPVRRRSSNDELPELDLTPVLIRCREWREHIRQPIPVLLKNIATITGQLSLDILGPALMPLLKKGRILLLVDGLDEIQNDADRSTFVDHLETFLSDYSNIRMVVTSREAGFSLVAPSIARFCSRWRVAPLEESAIELLCVHWHTLMKGPSNDSFAEARDVAERLLQNDSLRRLAENPLLLTMLLVVKHGAGQLPPDRVSLYERAVEVLLDTWNIKGHEPLNLKEAVPQLAYVAFELMRKGAQTATEKELLLLLEEAREKVPQIQRYAKDTPDKFLKRVELRSSLLVEAGHQLEGTRTVPFYQFRHLTFQEFLAAVAAVDGHYVGYKSSDTILTPLKPYVTAHEWKEVIPMAAVRAKKQAEPLMIALVDEINCLREALENSDLESNELSSPDSNVDEEGIPAVTRLVQCLAEEAEASPSTLTTALQLIVLFARGCHDTEEGWQAIVRGPYGAELLHQAWLQYLSMQWPRRSHLPVTFARLLEFRKPLIYWHTKIGKLELEHALRSVDEEEITRALLTLVSMCWRSGEGSDVVKELLERKDFFEYHLFSNRRGIWDAAAWGWALSRRSLGNPEPPIPVLDHLLALWLGGEDKWGVTLYALAHGGSGLRTRRSWQPVLTAEQKDFVRQATNRKDNSNPDEGFVVLGALVVAFYAQNIWPDKELHEKFINVGEMEYREIDYKFMVAQLVP